MHVDYQLPDKHSRVGFLLNAIENDDAVLQAAMTNVKDDTGSRGKRNEFERVSVHVLPKDLVIKRRTNAEKRNYSEISEMTLITGRGD